MCTSLHVKSMRVGLSLAGLILLAIAAFAGRSYAQCSNPSNAIVAENCLPGNPDSEWDVSTSDAGDPTLQGFATDISVNQGSTVNFKIKTDARAYVINIYRMGYYGGMGARKVASISPSVSLPQTQPACLVVAATGLIDCGNWAVSASWQVPANATSGIYFAHLIRSDTSGDSHILFIIRNDSSHSAVLYQTADESWQAYNYYGNGSLYGPASPSFDVNGRSYKVSYNRPFSTRSFGTEKDTWVFGPEYPMVQWLEANGYDVTYFTGVDAARNGALIQNHKIYMDSGHDEYWSGPQRANVQAARDAGVNLAFFSGNEIFWKTRWENSIDGSNTPNRTLACYKETFAFAKIDPTPTWTGTWRDPSFSPPSDGGKPENSLTGTLYMVNGPGADNDGTFPIKVPSDDGKMRFWRNTAAASLASNATYTLPISTLAYEWDLDIDNGVRPAGAFRMSTTTHNLTTDLLLDSGVTYGAGTATHHLMMYRAPSGALVFGAGTVNWSWGLNSNHDNPFASVNQAPDPNMQQATVNLFADMGAQPASLQSGLIPASASSDTTPPTSVVTAPASGSSVTAGSSVTVTGTAGDVGGVVAGVEVSADSGATWHPATGRSPWSYAWTPNSVGTSTILSRAVDDSGNLETPHNGVSISVLPRNCPCSIWNSSNVPTTIDSGDGSSIEVGAKFRTDTNGSILGVRFYKATANTGTHVGHIWTSGGALLGTATFSSESASGWQQVSFPAPVSVSANTTYVVSYFAPAGRYSADTSYFASSGFDNPPLHALANGVDGQNGVYLYSSAGGFPNFSYGSTNYWVDVVYTASTTFGISGTITGIGGAGATVNLAGTSAASTTADSSGIYSFSGLLNGSYTVAPSNTGVSFTPTSRAVTINGTAVTSVNFTAAATQALSISGTISSGAGATVNLGGAATLTTTADASGNYVFNGLLNGSYTVTPVASGYTFSPGTQTVILSGTNATGVNFQGQVCACSSIWQPSATPSLIDSGDTTPVELGVKFRADSQGYITALRFYKATANTGTHVGHLWTTSGTLLGSATFSGESGQGWQQVTFPSPILISANTTYVASYFAPVAHYSANTNFFATIGVDNPPLHALATGVDGPNGLYIYTSNGAFPNNSYASTNYWIDVVYTTSQTHSLSGTITGSGGAGASLALSGPTTASTTADGAGNYIFGGLQDGSYTVTTVTAGNAGTIFMPGSQGVTINGSNVTGVNFAVPPNCPCSTIWQPSVQPALIDASDVKPVELGLKFRADSDGYIVGLRYYKSPNNTGAHVGNLWSSTGKLLATAAATSESVSGWQQIAFSRPVPVTANTTYITSYFVPVGHYSANSGYFATAGVDSPPLHALANGVDGQNGVFAYSSTSTFPTSSYNSTNYWVDVIYGTATSYSIAGTISGNGGAGATVTLSGAAAATTTADATGKYSFNGLANGTYTITPGNTGYTFSPLSRSVTINGAHALGIDFSIPTTTYSISGMVTGATGASVNLTGTATATTTVDASGNYSYTGLASGSYTVSPSAAGYLLSPTNQIVTITAANIAGVNFTATAQTYTISGTISGTGGPGATITLTGAATTTATADASGIYSFSGLINGSYTVTPTKSGYSFTPASQTVTVSNASIAANFTSTAFTYLLSGTISGPGGPGATVKLTGAAAATVTANASGVYSFPAVTNGSYTVKPTKTGYIFTPTSRSVTVSGANVTANFSSVLKTYSISGTISGPGGPGASVALTGAATTTITANSSGVFNFSGLANGSYTVTPSKTGNTFTPTSQAVTVNLSNVTGVNFGSL